MDIKTLNHRFAISSQLHPEDLPLIKALGFRSILCNRPDNEAADQPEQARIEQAASAAGIAFEALTISKVEEAHGLKEAMADLLERLPEPILAYCRTANRSRALWAQVHPNETADAKHDVVIIGAGAGGLAAAASLLKRDPTLNIAVIDPKSEHDYQPGWTLVGARVFTPEQTRRATAQLMPAGVHWLKEQVFGVDPDSSRVVCSSGKVIEYRCLIAAPGIKLDWDGIAGLRETLGSNGVTSNYSIQHAPYTWELVRGLQSGRAVFTQPPMPIKCAGAPQKALYLSCDHWQRQGRLGKIQADFYLAGGVLFGVPDYVPALEGYVRRYNANLHFNRTLKAVDGPARTAVFAPAGETGEEQQVQFDMLHVCPPQQAPDFIRASALSDSAGWIEVDAETLQHARYPNIFGLGDAAGTSNAKTAAAVRKQAPVVAANAIALLRGKELGAAYEGYGSCPLTVERGRVVLAEFNYAGKLAPTLPKWIMDGTKPTRLGWLIKASLLSPMYFHLMLKGREWFAAPRRRARGQSGNPAAAATGPSK